MTLIQHLQEHYPIDPTRISVTGMSMGGTGTWHLAVTHPNRFAAIAPVCGDNVWYVGDTTQICAIRPSGLSTARKTPLFLLMYHRSWLTRYRNAAETRGLPSTTTWDIIAGIRHMRHLNCTPGCPTSKRKKICLKENNKAAAGHVELKGMNNKEQIYD
ncbi:MAG TPA: alpha/beta hydrolase-fold protein [Anaerolineales bacterium]|nr:alpha/beta hydrolase-fold protein [Anaerolineales bacterium]